MLKLGRNKEVQSDSYSRGRKKLVMSKNCRTNNKWPRGLITGPKMGPSKNKIRL